MERAAAESPAGDAGGAGCDSAAGLRRRQAGGRMRSGLAARTYCRQEMSDGRSPTNRVEPAAVTARDWSLPDHPAPAGDGKGRAPFDPPEPVRLRGQSAGHEGRRGARWRSCLRYGRQGADAESQGQTAAVQVPLRLHQELEEGDGDPRRRASHRLLLNRSRGWLWRPGGSFDERSAPRCETRELSHGNSTIPTDFAGAPQCERERLRRADAGRQAGEVAAASAEERRAVATIRARSRLGTAGAATSGRTA